MNTIQIGSVKVGERQPPFIIAEMSGNHRQSLKSALAIVDAVAQSGAHAIKLQTYTADTITLDASTSDFMIDNPESLWHGRRLYDLYAEAHTPWDWHAPIMKHARSLGLEVFSSPFDHTAVDFLEALNVPAYKIASFELTHLPLIRKVAKTGKPIIMSTGLATEADIELAVKTAREAGAHEIILLKCTSAYPAQPQDAHLMTLQDMKKFGTVVGLSDHTLGVGVSVAAVVLGACVIEKHVTLSRAEGGVDAAFSLEPIELKQLVDETHAAWAACGTVQYGGTDAEQASKRYRQSIYVAQDVCAGDQVTEENIRIVRPGFGVLPRYWDKVLGQYFKVDRVKGSPLSFEDISPQKA